MNNESIPKKDKFAIVCQNLSRSYGEVEAVKDLNLEIPYGSIFGFLGRNGAGKTTTIRMLTGLAHPTTGRAWVGGLETTNTDSTSREKFGYLPQEPTFYNWMTPIEFLDYVAQLFGLPARIRKERIQETLELVELKDAAKRHIKGFSGGMMQRLGIAQAMIHQPPVLFLDEPTSALDPAGRYEVLELINKLRGKTTVFLSSHILQDVERVCDTIAIIRKGELILVSDREELISRFEANTVKLTFNSSQNPDLTRLVKLVEPKNWLEKTTISGNSVRFAVKDLDQAKHELLPLVVQSQLVLDHYEWVRPSLEEVFLKLSR
jgi:ABC-2 type transport system ATP-binding protein